MIRSAEIHRFAKTSVIVWIQEGLILLACFFYLIYRVHPVLSLEAQTPVFLMGAGFWGEFLKIPGGFTDWLSLLFMQFWFSDFWSALFLTICFWMVAFLTRKWIETLTENRSIHTFHLIPVVLLLVLHSQYDFRFSITIALIINLLFLILFMRWAPKQQLLRAILALSVSVLLYWITGGAFLIFAVLCGLDDLFFRKQFTSGLLLLLIAAILPMAAAALVFLVPLKQAYWHNLSIESPLKIRIAGYALNVFYFLILIFFFMMKFGGMRKLLQRITGFVKPAYIWKCVAGTLFLLSGTGLLAQESYDDMLRLVHQINRSAKEGRWMEVLASVQHDVKVNALLSYQTNLALFHTNTLLDNMFTYPQTEGTVGLLMNRTWCLAWPEEVSNLCWKLGLINGALHWAHEALEYKGASPEILKRLGMVYMVKGNNEAANHFFLNLRNIPFHKKTAEDLIQLNSNHSELVQTGVYKYIQSCMPVDEMISLGRPSSADLELLLQRNPKNKMAFEYLIAYHLLNGNWQEILKHISDFNSLPYLKLPRYVQEVVILGASMTPDADQNQLNKLIDPLINSRYKEYRQILAKHMGKKESAKQSLQAHFGDTYWYYLMFVKPPLAQTENPDEFQ